MLVYCRERVVNGACRLIVNADPFLERDTTQVVHCNPHLWLDSFSISTLAAWITFPHARLCVCPIVRPSSWWKHTRKSKTNPNASSGWIGRRRNMNFCRVDWMPLSWCDVSKLFNMLLMFYHLTWSRWNNFQRINSHLDELDLKLFPKH